MAKKEKERKQFFKTKGTVYWAKLNPDYPDLGPTNYPKENLQVSLIPDDWSDIEAAGVTTVYDATETIPSKFMKVKTTLVDKETGKLVRPKVKDAKNNELPQNLELGNGSVVYVLWSPFDYGNGVSATLYGVQVVDLVPYEREGGTDFEEEEDGYTFEGDTNPLGA